MLGKENPEYDSLVLNTFNQNDDSFLLVYYIKKPCFHVLRGNWKCLP